MPSYSHEKYSFQYSRDSLEPVNENEYDSIKSKGEECVADFLEELEDGLKKRENPWKFDLKFFLVFLILGILLLATGSIIKAKGNFDTGDIFHMLSFFAFFTLLIQPVQYLKHAQKLSFEKTTFLANARTYYLFHATKIETANSYIDYQRIISGITHKEYLSFIWKNG